MEHGRGGSTDADELRTARVELDEAVRAIRRLPGHEDFLNPPGFGEAAAVSTDRPLVYLAATVVAGLALCVRGSGVVSVRLPQLNDRELGAAVAAYQEAYEAWRRDPATGLAHWRSTLDSTCRWLWTAAVGPLLTALPTSSATFVPCGQLGFLPLHAAWEPAAGVTGRRYLLDSVSVSYVPSARALHAAQNLRASSRVERLLTVVDPRPVAAGHLPLAAAEVAAAEAALPGAQRLEGERASVRNVRAALPTADVLHFAGHGVSSLTDPMSSALMLAGDDPLTLRQIFDLPLTLRLAVLSACETAIPGQALPDEVIALPTGLLQAGAAGVVASQWALEDVAAAMVLAEFYRIWRPGSDHPATALCAAQRWVRDTTNGEKAAVYAAARGSGDGWLPPGAAAALHAEVAWDDPADRAYQSIDAWAGLAYVGA